MCDAYDERSMTPVPESHRSVRAHGRRWAARILLILLGGLAAACPKNSEDALMLQLYLQLHEEIERAAYGTDISPAYLAALISLESWPPGNRESERFEPKVYENLLDLKHGGEAWGGLRRERIRRISDEELRRFATSYGLTQIMGYHCLSLGCTIEELKGEYHLQWAAAFMQFTYGRRAKRRDWTSCFRIHNTGRPNGRPHRDDYVERGLVRMQYYEEWIRKKGQML